MVKNWIIKEQGIESELNHLISVLGIERGIANLLWQRGIRTFDQAKDFFRPQLNQLHDPFLMPDMQKAVDRIRDGIQRKEGLLVYGDYDVDGTTAVSLIYGYFKDYFPTIDYYIPDRYEEGYGISYRGIDYAHEKGFKLIIALDCGIKANSRIEYARERGIDFIICDHHTPGAVIPQAVAVLDAKRADSIYPFSELSGCGVGFKLVQAFQSAMNRPFEELEKFLDLVVISIASDMVPINGENRILAHYGLKRINENPSIGIKAILQIANIENKEIQIEDIVFKIGPRINAAGRMESGKKSVDLLISGNIQEARIIGQKINVFNSDRRNVDTLITQEALNMIHGDARLREKKSTVLFNPEWHKGVIGIVASRLMDHYYRPTIILTRSNGFAAGSARSVNGFDLYQAIEECSDLLENFGGHKYAAGLTMKIENVPEFQKKFEKIVAANIEPDQMVPTVEIDTEISLCEINDKFVRLLKQFRPHGPENMAPVFLTENVSDNGECRCVGLNSEHLKLSLVQEQDPYQVFRAIAFQQGSKYPVISRGLGFDICFCIDENEFRGEKSIQLNLRDIKMD